MQFLNWIFTYTFTTRTIFSGLYVFNISSSSESDLWSLVKRETGEHSLGVAIALNACACASTLGDLWIDLRNERNNSCLDCWTGGGGAGHSFEPKFTAKFSWQTAPSARVCALCLGWQVEKFNVSQIFQRLKNKGNNIQNDTHKWEKWQTHQRKTELWNWLIAAITNSQTNRHVYWK